MPGPVQRKCFRAGGPQHKCSFLKYLLLIHGKEKFEIMKKNENKAALPPNNTSTMAQALQVDFFEDWGRKVHL